VRDLPHRRHLRDGQRHDVGTIQLSSGKGSNQPLAGVGFDTPTLSGTWNAASYFHNGQAATLQDVLAGGHGNASSLPPSDVVALREYVRSLDTAPPFVARLRSELSGMCVNIKAGAAASGTTAVQWPCGNASHEKFTVTPILGGYVQFVAEHSGLCLAQNGTATTNAPVVQVACSAGNTTQWSVVGGSVEEPGLGLVPRRAEQLDHAGHGAHHVDLQRGHQPELGAAALSRATLLSQAACKAARSAGRLFFVHPAPRA
jgi:hypothetical protein